MGILDKAQELASLEKKKREEEKQAEKERQQSQDELVEVVRNRVLDVLLSEIHGRLDFSVKTAGVFKPSLAKIICPRLSSGELCSIIVEGRTHTAKYSEDTPEQDVWDVFVDVLKDGKSYTLASVNYISYVDNAMNKFSEAMARIIKDYV